MPRKLLRPRLWWLLVLPLLFYLNQKAYLGIGSVRILVDLYQAEHFVKTRNNTAILYYEVLGIHLEPPVYDVVTFIMKACLVIGCLSVLKELFLKKPLVPTT